MRIDRLLFLLRFSKTRSIAQRQIDQGHIRCNLMRIERHSHEVAPGDVLTIPVGQGVRVIEVLGIPTRRGPAKEAQSFYRALDPDGKTDLAAQEIEEPEGNSRS